MIQGQRGCVRRHRGLYSSRVHSGVTVYCACTAQLVTEVSKMLAESAAGARDDEEEEEDEEVRCFIRRRLPLVWLLVL